MKLEEMKRIAEARTKKEWKYSSSGVDVTYTEDLTCDDCAFIDMASNQWDKLIAVVESAEKLSDSLLSPGGSYDGATRLRAALKALDEP